ncbi:MAG: hypothetical protein MI725_08360 [Pirellulales bacterium]|nr:hypothetical protein [Pirellulales bacterium]
MEDNTGRFLGRELVSDDLGLGSASLAVGLSDLDFEVARVLAGFFFAARRSMTSICVEVRDGVTHRSFVCSPTACCTVVAVTAISTNASAWTKALPGPGNQRCIEYLPPEPTVGVGEIASLLKFRNGGLTVARCSAR